MKKLTGFALLMVLVGSLAAGCLNQEYTGGFRTWTPEPIHPDHGGAFDRDAYYLNRERTDLNRVQVGLAIVDLRKGHSPTEVAQIAARLVDAEPETDLMLDVDPVTGEQIKLRIAVGPIEKDMIWPILANAIEMASPNTMRAKSYTNLLWQIGTATAYGEGTGGYIVRPAPVTAASPATETE